MTLSVILVLNDKQFCHLVDFLLSSFAGVSYLIMYTDSSKGQSLFGDNNTDILCRQKLVALLCYQCYCSHMTTEKNYKITKSCNKHIIRGVQHG